MGAEQMTIQANYIELLEKKISDYETKTAQSFCQFESNAKNLWDKIYESSWALEDMKNITLMK